MRRALNITPELLGAQLGEIFGDFRTLGDPELEKALRESVKFCCDMASHNIPGRWLTLLGPSGTGKTMLAKRIAKFFRRHLNHLPDERNSPGEAWVRRGGFKPWIDVVNDMFSGDYSGIRQLCGDWFICLDDIGVEYQRNKELAVSQLFRILNGRQGLFTVITANIPLEEIGDKLDVRISSRLLRDGASVVNVAAEDFNLRAA